MPVSAPLHIRVGFEYTFALGISVIVAALYALYTNADFYLALALGLVFILVVWFVTQAFRARSRGKSIHVFTAIGLAVTLYVVLRMAGVA